jgi:hypothetical protein
VEIGKVSCGADAAVRLAAEDDVAAVSAASLVELAGARGSGVVAVAAVGVLDEPSLELVPSALEHAELGPGLHDDDVQPSKSASCCGPAVTSHVTSIPT